MVSTTIPGNDATDSKNRGFLERGHAQNLENFGEAAVELQFLLEDSHQDVDTDSNPHLGLQGVDGVAVESLDPQVLFDPLGKKKREEEKKKKR